MKATDLSSGGVSSEWMVGKSAAAAPANSTAISTTTSGALRAADSIRR